MTEVYSWHPGFGMYQRHRWTLYIHGVPQRTFSDEEKLVIDDLINEIKRDQAKNNTDKIP